MDRATLLTLPRDDLIALIEAQAGQIVALDDRRVARILEASVTHGLPNLCAGAGVTTGATVHGAALGDVAHASFSPDMLGIRLTARVSAAHTVSSRFQQVTWI